MKFSTLLLLAISVSFLHSQTVEIELFASGLDRPVNIKHAGDNRLFVVEQEGTISIIEANGTVNATPFLDITDRVGTIGAIGDERGLLGLAFHPNYVNNGFFYVNYIDNSGDTVISRFSRSSNNSANQNSEFIIMTINQLFSNHNGGDMTFGPDGYLYISVGDGGGSGDPQNQSQQLNTLLGKILRIDVDNTSDGNNYAIPPNNPFISNSAALNEIWAYGLRNAWKFSFDRETDDIWIADVGEFDIEEINRISFSEGNTGLNYGWRCYEGNDTFNTTDCPSSNTLTFPVAQYSHFNDGEFKCSITGGYRYRGNEFPNMQGLYFFADYCSDEIGYLEENGNSWDMTLLDQSGTNGWTSFGEDINGELYIGGIISGNIFRIVDNSLSVAESRLEQVKIYPNPTSDEVFFEFGNIQINNVSIFDLQGKLVKQIKVGELQSFMLSTKSFAKGVYFAEIEASNGTSASRKLIIN